MHDKNLGNRGIDVLYAMYHRATNELWMGAVCHGEAECGGRGDGRGEEQQARGARSSAAATDLSSVGPIGGELAPGKGSTEHESQRLERLGLDARSSGSGADTRGEKWALEESQILAQNLGQSGNTAVRFSLRQSSS
jgi:hypothetical protein